MMVFIPCMNTRTQHATLYMYLSQGHSTSCYTHSTLEFMEEDNESYMYLHTQGEKRESCPGCISLPLFACHVCACG